MVFFVCYIRSAISNASEGPKYPAAKAIVAIVVRIWLLLPVSGRTIDRENEAPRMRSHRFLSEPNIESSVRKKSDVKNIQAAAQ